MAGRSARRLLDAIRVGLPRLGRPLARNLELPLLVIGLACLGWVGWAFLDAHQFQRLASAGELAVPVLDIDGGAVEISEGSVVCRLRIPRVGVEAVVAEGVSERVLRRAIGHLPGSPLPGRVGNVVLAGHRDTFVRNLEGIRVGDAIHVDSGAGTDLYLVEWIRVVAPSEVAVLASTEDPALTLVTCYPFRYIGAAPSRFVVRARHASGPAGGDGRNRGAAPTA